VCPRGKSQGGVKTSGRAGKDEKNRATGENEKKRGESAAGGRSREMQSGSGGGERQQSGWGFKTP